MREVPSHSKQLCLEQVRSCFAAPLVKAVIDGLERGEAEFTAALGGILVQLFWSYWNGCLEGQRADHRGNTDRA